MKKLITFIFGIMLSLQLFAQTTDYYLENLQTTDTYIANGAPNTSFGSNQNLITGGWGDMYITLIKFNISNLPAIATGDKVSIFLYNKNPGFVTQPTAVNMGLSATNFNDTHTWNNGVSWYTSTIRQVNVNPYSQYTEFDITDYYNYWKNGTANNGIVLVPLNTSNYFNHFQSASVNTPAGQKPILRVVKGVVNSNVINLKWPLSTPYASRTINQKFGADWAGGTTCSVTGVIKKHNGTDYAASNTDLIYAAEAGIVKAVFPADPWAKVITIEHAKANGSKFTTSYWHVSPYVAPGVQVSRGSLIAAVADLGTRTHFHFGVRDGSYFVNSTPKDVSSSGALPQTNCDGWPAFPEKFVDPEGSAVKFQ
jgi:murein DD-endopeptidase MepM/ murein hydrolase activator NlpD